MNMRKCIPLCLIITLQSISLLSFSQTISIVNKTFVVNGDSKSPIYFNGANVPWESWNDFGGNYDSLKWKQDFEVLKANGINSARIWFSCNGEGQPSLDINGTVHKPSDRFWKDCDNVFAHAKNKGVYIMATLMSFDHTKPNNKNYQNWQAMINDTAKIRTYLNNYLIPFVNRYKTNPYFWSIDICNEIEWIAENGDKTNSDKNWGCSYEVLQRFVSMCCVAMHSKEIARKDNSRVLVTLGSAAVKWNGTYKKSASFSTETVPFPDGNKWSDKALQSAYKNKAAYLDFYSPHFYAWVNEWFSNPFEKSPADYGISDKACVVGEMPSRNPFPLPQGTSTPLQMLQLTAYENMLRLGWQGHFPWTANIDFNLTDEVGTIKDFGEAAKEFKKAHPALVK